MRQGQLTSDDILFGRLDLETMDLAEIGSLDAEWWRADATPAHHTPARSRSTTGYEQPDWLSAERQEYGTEPGDDEAE